MASFKSFVVLGRNEAGSVHPVACCPTEAMARRTIAETIENLQMMAVTFPDRATTLGDYAGSLVVAVGTINIAGLIA